MTVSVEHKSVARKGSWDSKMSVSTVSTGPRHYRRSPGSIISSDSDIRFTRKKLSSQYRCGCCIIACFLLLLLLAAAAVYVGYTFFILQPPEEQIYRGTFKVTKGDMFLPEFADPSNSKFKTRTRDYRERLNLLFRRSAIRDGFVGTEVLALDGNEGKDLIVHFNIHIDPTYVSVDAKDLENIIIREIAVHDSQYFKNLTIDSNSIEIIPNDLITQPVTTTAATSPIVITSTTRRPPRKCSKVTVNYCKKLAYNVTTYPNILGHESAKDVDEDVIAFRELVDAECYRHAYEFVCEVLQPACKRGNTEDEMVLPCRSFCRDFIAGCGNRLLGKFKDLLDCGRFPEYGETGTCLTKPACVQEMQSRALSPRICDGVVDCQDLSDEKSCTYCPKNHIHCGIGQKCISAEKRCDGRQDCPDGSDERACLSLAQSIKNITKATIVTPHLPRYNADGFVVFNEKGEIGKLCAGNLNDTVLANRSAEVLHTVASSLCQSLSYRKVFSVRVEKDTEDGITYVSMKDPTAQEIVFVRSTCPSKQVLKISCAELECGIQATHIFSDTLSKMSSHGDWPWHVSLFKDDVHLCDGTLVSPQWIATTTSCFQGQPKAEWTARFASIRLTSSSPWAQERRIIGMVKSPIEGSTVALTKLDNPVVLNDFVRPICLPKANMGLSIEDQMNCNTLGWSRNRDQLQRVQVTITEMEKCENISISSENGLCAENAFGQEDCSEEEFAGSPMVCQFPGSNKWSLIGVTNWRIACSKTGVERPRLYDKITSNVDWIIETVSAIS